MADVDEDVRSTIKQLLDADADGKLSLEDAKAIAAKMAASARKRLVTLLDEDGDGWNDDELSIEWLAATTWQTAYTDYMQPLTTSTHEGAFSYGELEFVYQPASSVFSAIDPGLFNPPSVVDFSTLDLSSQSANHGQVLRQRAAAHGREQVGRQAPHGEHRAPHRGGHQPSRNMHKVRRGTRLPRARRPLLCGARAGRPHLRGRRVVARQRQVHGLRSAPQHAHGREVYRPAPQHVLGTYRAIGRQQPLRFARDVGHVHPLVAAEQLHERPVARPAHDEVVERLHDVRQRESRRVVQRLLGQVAPHQHGQPRHKAAQHLRRGWGCVAPAALQALYSFPAVPATQRGMPRGAGGPSAAAGTG